MQKSLRAPSVMITWRWHELWNTAESTVWPQCHSVGWTPVRPGIKEGQRYAVNTTPNIHFPVLQAELFWERGEGLINSFYFSILTFLSTILPQLFAFVPASPGWPASYWCKSGLPYLSGCVNWFHQPEVSQAWKFLWTSSLPVHYKSKTNWPISSGFCLCFSQIPINFKTD